MKIEKLTRQPLSDSDYLLLFGVANWVFNSNFGFMSTIILTNLAVLDYFFHA